MTNPESQKTILFSAGYRVFFPLAALSVIFSLGYWLLLVTGHASYLPSRFLPAGWHQHEMIFGMVAAVIIGFLYTAVPNWTGQRTPTGRALAALMLIWILGRLAVFFSAMLPVWLPVIVDGIFLPLAIAGIVRALIKVENKRNYFLPVLLMLFAGLNIASHLAAMEKIDIDERQLFLSAVFFIVFLMNVIGGRIIPSFTRNKYPNIKMAEPAALLPLSAAAIFSLAAAFLMGAEDMIIGSLAGVAGILTLIRSLSWQGWKVIHDPLLFILHIGYFWIPVGFFLMAYSSFGGPVLLSHALHAFTAGAIGSLTLGVMSRATLGHSGLSLNNEITLTVIFLSVNVAALARVIMPLVSDVNYLSILQGAGLLWLLAYGLFLTRFITIFFRPRKI